MHDYIQSKEGDYRIVKKTYRDEGQGYLYCRFYVEEFKKGIFGTKWRPVEVMQCYGMDCYKEALYYNTEEQAIQHIKNLLVEVPQDEIIYTNLTK